jgi:hypothetical protein
MSNLIPTLNLTGRNVPAFDTKAGVFAVATILGVVAIMAAPEVAGVLAGGAALNYFLGWSTVGMITWGAGHLMVC